jgi:hypothetical protein
MCACATDAPMCALMCVCARVCVWARTYPRRSVEAVSVGMDRVRHGSQPFWSATAFNADIGAWNTASAMSFERVCASFGPAARHRKRPECARPGFDAAQPVVRGSTADAHACAHV